MQKKTTKPKPSTKNAINKRIQVNARQIRLLILDVDGVLTDGGIILDNNGNEIKIFHVRDGHGIKLLQRNGIEVAIITGRDSRVVDQRAKELGIGHVYQKCYNKTTAYNDLKNKLTVADHEIAYIGDDVVDIPVMKRAGLPVAVADAHEDILAYAGYITRNPGGRCAVREVAEIILKAKGLWEGIINGYMEA